MPLAVGTAYATAVHVPQHPGADLPQDRAQPPLFKLVGPNVRACPLTIILTIRDDDIKNICVSQILFAGFLDL